VTPHEPRGVDGIAGVAGIAQREPLLGARFADDGKPLIYLDRVQLRVKRDVEQKVANGTYDFVTAPCALCGRSSFQSLAHKDRCGLRTPVVVCTDCGLVQTNPRMSADAYRAYYQAEYRILQYDRSTPQDAFVRERARGQAIVAYLERSGLWPKQPTPFVIDVGCGSGGVLSAFADRGCRVLGVDLAVERLKLAREQFGLELVDGSLADLQLDGARPALVIYSHSLEHMLDINRDLETLRNLIGPDSQVYVEVPGIKSLDLYGDDFLLYLQNAHVYHFSLETLTQLLEKHAFARVSGDETIRAVFKPAERTAAQADRSDYVSVLDALAESEARIARLHPMSAARNLASRLRLITLARSARRNLRKLRFYLNANELRERLSTQRPDKNRMR
jgi:SAM-dependent methyltransferase